MPKRFKQYEDGDSGLKYWRELTSQCFHLLWLQYTEEYDSSIEVRYWVELMEIDLAATTNLQLEEANKSMGAVWETTQEARDSFWTADMLAEYGAKAVLFHNGGNNKETLLKLGREESYALDDPYQHEEAMCTPVNKMGSTAREYFQGGNVLHLAIARGVAQDQTSSKILAKMHGAKDEEIKRAVGVAAMPPVHSVHASIRLQDISRDGQSDDPLAYSQGYLLALSGGGLPLDNRQQLAGEYVLGYRFGVDVRAGRLAKPAWHR